MLLYLNNYKNLVIPTMHTREIIFLIVAYFLVLILISFFTSKNATNDTFFKANNAAPWYLVAFGMIGASLSGVTFISVPGAVKANQFGYMQMVLGYFFGYLVITYVLLPLYYKLKLTSIYSYLEDRFGKTSYQTGAIAFLISRTIGAAFRLFLVAIVLNLLVFEPLGLNFEVAVIITIALIWVYTFKGGIKTILFTDTLQTLFMIVAVLISIYIISKALNINSVPEVFTYVKNNPLSKTFFIEDYKHPQFFLKSFFAGIFITITMTGLDQDMMQKNLSCKSLKDAQKNMLWFSVVLILVNIIFLTLGLLLTDYAASLNITASKDKLFPTIAMLPNVGKLTSAFFLLGLIAAAYSSADSALTSLTTSFSIDILKIDRLNKKLQNRYRKLTHIGFSIVLIITIIIFKNLFTDTSVIWELFKAAGYTYGPLLGLFSFGLFTKKQIHDKWVWLIAVISPITAYLINYNSEKLFNGYQIGFEIILINGLLMFGGLLAITTNKSPFKK